AVLARSGQVDDVRIPLGDQAVQVNVDEAQARRSAPVTQEPRLDVLRSQWLTQQRILAEVDLRDGQIVGRVPVSLRLMQQRRREWPDRGGFLAGVCPSFPHTLHGAGDRHVEAIRSRHRGFLDPSNGSGGRHGRPMALTRARLLSAGCGFRQLRHDLGEQQAPAACLLQWFVGDQCEPSVPAPPPNAVTRVFRQVDRAVVNSELFVSTLVVLNTGPVPEKRGGGRLTPRARMHATNLAAARSTAGFPRSPWRAARALPPPARPAAPQFLRANLYRLSVTP